MDEKCTCNDRRILNCLLGCGCKDATMLLRSLSLITSLPMNLVNIFLLYLSSIHCSEPTCL